MLFKSLQRQHYNKHGQEHTFPSRCFGLIRPSLVSVCSNITGGIHIIFIVYTYIYIYIYINYLFAGYNFLSEPCCRVHGGTTNPRGH